MIIPRLAICRKNQVLSTKILIQNCNYYLFSFFFILKKNSKNLTSSVSKIQENKTNVDLEYQTKMASKRNEGTPKNDDFSFNLKELKKTVKEYDYNEGRRKLTELEKVRAIENFDQKIIEKLKRQMNNLEASIEYRDKLLIFLRNKSAATQEGISHLKTEVKLIIFKKKKLY